MPFLGGELSRYSKVSMRGIDHDGEPLDVEVDDFTARIFQHEIDHTDGHVYLDRMPDMRSLGYTIVLSAATRRTALIAASISVAVVYRESEKRTVPMA